MVYNVERQKRDLRRLVAAASQMIEDLNERIEQGQSSANNRNKSKKLEAGYQDWYTEAYALIKEVIPDRLEEFAHLYRGDGKATWKDGTSFTIQHWLLGYRSPTYRDYGGVTRREFDDVELIRIRFWTQSAILQSASRRFDSALFKIKRDLQADMFESQLEEAKGLAKGGFTRAAGCIAGVVLEKLLVQVRENHNIRPQKNHASISDINDALRRDGILDLPTWRQIQRLGDIINICSHSKERVPKEVEVDDLISSVEKLTKAQF